MYVCAAVRIRRSRIIDIHTCHFSLNLHSRIAVANLQHILGRYVRNGTGQFFLRNGTVTYHHHFVQEFGVVFEHYGKIFPVSDRNFLCHVADVRDLKNGFLRHLERKMPVNVGDHAVACAFLHNIGADHRLPFGINHFSADTSRGLSNRLFSGLLFVFRKDDIRTVDPILDTGVTEQFLQCLPNSLLTYIERILALDVYIARVNEQIAGLRFDFMNNLFETNVAFLKRDFVLLLRQYAGMYTTGSQ